jgi:hypothetical protein
MNTHEQETEPEETVQRLGLFLIRVYSRSFVVPHSCCSRVHSWFLISSPQIRGYLPRVRAAKRKSLVRPLIQGLHPYVPGEQPKIAHLIKLNTNENPYPPSPKVLSAVKGATDGRLRLYPNPTAQPLREALARFHRCAPENIIVGNGSDEILAMAVRAFVEPLSKANLAGPCSQRIGRSILSLPATRYNPVLAEIHGAQKRAVPLETDLGCRLTETSGRAVIGFSTRRSRSSRLRMHQPGAATPTASYPASVERRTE